MRGLLLIAAVLAVFAAAAPAQATVTPVNSAFTGTSTNSSWTEESNGIRMRCPRSTFAGRTSADGKSVSGTLDFVRSGAVTCTESIFGSSVTWACRGNITWRSTSSVAGTSFSGTWAVDSGFECAIRPSIGSARSIRGPQTPTNCTWTVDQRTQTLTTVCNTIAVDGGGESGFAASYRVDQRLTVS